MFLYASLISDVCYTSDHLEQHVTVGLHKNFASLPREQFTEIPKQQLLRWKNSLQKRKNVPFPITMQRPKLGPCSGLWKHELRK